jgi:protein-ribulosamine 3-kinase
MSPVLRAAIEDAVTQASGSRLSVRDATPASGGCIHSTWAISGDNSRYFVKTNEARFAESFDTEVDGLVALTCAGMRAPQPIARGEAAGQAFLVLEYLPLGDLSNNAFRELGRRLAHLHEHRGANFGWHRDNFIGLTPQSNATHASWAEFWREERLAPQLALAARNNYGGRVQSLGKQLLNAVPSLLADYDPPVSLLHGDLWRGNAASLLDGTPVVFDPAVYYGDAEADLAMTELFGGFPPSFYDVYRDVRPIGEGYAVRRTLYNLYHVLNHLNLFGESYRSQAERGMERLLADLRY